MATLDRIEGPDGFGPGTDLPALRALLGADDAARPADPVPAARDALALVRVRIEHWHLDGRDRDVLHDGLAQTRRHARRAMAQAVADPSAHAIHEWRKRIKDGWYQARLLSPIRPEVLHPLAEQAGILAEDLGDHHDLAVLADHLTALPQGALTRDGQAEILARIRTEQDRLEMRAFAAGAILLAEKPNAMARRWTGWRQDWRG